LIQKTKYPNIHVDISKTDGNVFSIASLIANSLAENGVSPLEINEFMDECIATKSFVQFLFVCLKWVDI